MNILTIADATPGHENYWWVLIGAVVIIALALIIGKDAIRGAIIPPDEKEDTEQALKKLNLNQQLKPVSYKKDELVGYDSHITVSEHPYFKGEYYSSN